MLSEHQTGRAHVRAMRKFAPEVTKDGPGRASFVEEARGWCSLLENHIGKENMVLFSMADGLLQHDANRLNEVFAKYEATHLGILGWDGWSAKIDALAARYGTATPAARPHGGGVMCCGGH
jgi:hemerythrin-like domain-containing protein